MGGVRGDDGAKKLSGRKRHLLVDAPGLALRARVHSAERQDRAAVPLLLDGIAVAVAESALPSEMQRRRRSLSGAPGLGRKLR